MEFRKIILVCLVTFFSNMSYSQYEASPCFSTNPELGDSAYWSIEAIKHFDMKHYETAVKVVDACFEYYVYDAVEIQNKINIKNEKEPPIGVVKSSVKDKIQKNYLLNDVSLALWTKAVSLEKLERIQESKKAYSQCIHLTHGRAWDPNGWFWSPSDDCINRARDLLKKS
jgi:hypothetical protein